jgi:hypothetical protein
MSLNLKVCYVDLFVLEFERSVFLIYIRIAVDDTKQVQVAVGSPQPGSKSYDC